MRPKVVVGIQARLNSTRLPRKVLKKIGQSTIIEHIYRRSCSAASVDESYVLTGDLKSNEELVRLCERKGIPIVTGEEEDVMSRYVRLGKSTGADILVRLTGDNPMVQVDHVESIIEQLCAQRGLDYASNCLYQDFPLGLNAEAFSRIALGKVALDPTINDVEHVTASFRMHSGRFSVFHLKAPMNMHWPELRLTVDEEIDYVFLRELYDVLGERMWDLGSVIDFLRSNPRRIINDAVIQKGFHNEEK